MVETHRKDCFDFVLLVSLHHVSKASLKSEPAPERPHRLENIVVLHVNLSSTWLPLRIVVQVAYEVTGNPQSLLESAAALGFKSVSPSALDLRLTDSLLDMGVRQTLQWKFCSSRVSAPVLERRICHRILSLKT